MAETKKDKVTKKDIVNKMLQEPVILENEEYKKYLENELALLNKKSASSKSSKDEKERQAIAEMLLDEMAKLEATGKVQYTISELMNSSEVIQNYVCKNGAVLSNSKITNILREMLKGDNPLVVNVTDKKKSMYSLAK